MEPYVFSILGRCSWVNGYEQSCRFQTDTGVREILMSLIDDEGSFSAFQDELNSEESTYIG